MTSATEPWADSAFRTLRAAGYRVGGAREAVIVLLDRERGGLTAQNVADRLRDTERPVGSASVYRALAVLTKLNLVHGLDIGDGRTRYELVVDGGEHHHHLVCMNCGRTEAFGDSELEAVIARVESRAAYRVHDNDVILRGLCPRCERA